MGEIKCLFKEYLFTIRYEIKIFNSSNKVVSKGVTNEFGVFEYIPKNHGVYKIIARISNYPFCFNMMCTCCYYNGDTVLIPFIFTFPKNTSKHFVTINLKDKYYKNLQIKEGKVILCNT